MLAEMVNPPLVWLCSAQAHGHVEDGQVPAEDQSSGLGIWGEDPLGLRAGACLVITYFLVHGLQGRWAVYGGGHGVSAAGTEPSPRHPL